MEETILNRALQRSVNQQMAVWLTQQALLEAIKKAYESSFDTATAKGSLLQIVLDDMKADDAFFKNEITGRIGKKEGVHETIKTNKMAMEFERALIHLEKEDGKLLFQILSGKISIPDFDVPEPTDFAQIATHYYGSARATILTTILFCVWFTLTGRTIADVSNQCGILQKTNLPIDFGIPPGVKNRWLMRGASARFIPDILGIPHSGFAFGGHRPYPPTATFDLSILAELISPFSPEDASTFVSATFPAKMLELYRLQNPLSTADMQYGYRRHLLELPDFPYKDKINGGQFSSIDPAPFFLKECFQPTFDPKKGDLVLINRYVDTTSPEEDVIYNHVPKTGHCGIFYQGDQFVCATREIDWDWEGLGLHSYLKVNMEVDLRRKVSFLRVSEKYNPHEASTPVPTFNECKNLFNQRFSLKSTAGNLFAMAEQRKVSVNVVRSVATNRAKQLIDQYMTRTKRFQWGMGEASVMIWTDPITFRASIIPTPQLAAAPTRQPVQQISLDALLNESFENSEHGISLEDPESFTIASSGSRATTASFEPDPTPTYEVWEKWKPPPTLEINDEEFALDLCNELIGSGGKAHVLKGHTEKGVTVAVKVAPCRKQYTDEKLGFEREVGALQALKHPNIVQFYQSTIIDEFSYIILEYMERSLRTMLEEYGKIKLKNLPAFISPLLSALKYLHGHQLKIVHRDVKPENVLLTAGGLVKLIDFNVSSSSANQSEACVATLRYVPPETKRFAVTSKFDIWSVGIMLIELATGELPPYYRTAQTETDLCDLIGKATTEAILDGVDLPAQMLNFLERCLQIDPNQRADASELLRHEFLAGAQLPTSESVVHEELSDLDRLRAHLKSDDLKKAVAKLSAQGWDTLLAISSMTAEDFKECGIELAGHRRALLMAAQQLQAG